MQKYSKAIGCLTLIGLLILSFFIFKWFFEFLSTLEQSNFVTIISIFVSGLLGLILYMIQKYYEKQKEIDIELIKKKAEAYKEIISLWLKFFQAEKTVKDASKLPEVQNKILLELFDSSQRNLLLWGNEETLTFYSRFRRGNLSSGEDPKVIMREFGKFLKLLRKELGHKDKKLLISDIYGLFVNDVDLYSDILDKGLKK